MRGGVCLGPGSNATVRDNNTIESNTGYGICIDPGAVIFTKQVRWNTILGNTVGIQVGGTSPGPDYFHAECNWWNGTSSTPPYNLGPLDPSPLPPGQNPFGTGQPVSDYLQYRSWLIGPSNEVSTTCSGT